MDITKKVEMSPEFVRIIQAIVKQNAIIIEMLCNPLYQIEPDKEERQE